MALSDKEMETYVQIWIKVVDTQMHFNEMSGKSRQLGLTFVTAALGVGIVLLARGDDFSLPLVAFGFSFQVHVSSLIIFAAALALIAVRILDLNVYHKMLRGAVTFGEDFEENYMKQIFDLNKGMTQAISHFSRHGDAGKNLCGTKYEYTGTDEKNAEIKIRRFYNITIGTLVVVATLLIFVENFAREPMSSHWAEQSQNDTTDGNIEGKKVGDDAEQ